jgi:hypothetical protein
MPTLAKIGGVKMDAPSNANLGTYQAHHGKPYVAIVAGPTLHVFPLPEKP